MDGNPISGIILPPGFRFHPSDVELIIHYLQNKVCSRPLPASVIAEIDLYKYSPWELPSIYSFNFPLLCNIVYYCVLIKQKIILSTELTRYSVSFSLTILYDNREGSIWRRGMIESTQMEQGQIELLDQATGTDKPVLASATKAIGVKKALVFYAGRPPRGLKTDWVMHEYRLLDTMVKPSRSKGSMRLDEWVLCRVRQKGSILRNITDETPDRPSKEFVKYSSNIEELDPANRSCNYEMIADCLKKDCQLLASILAGQALPPLAASPSASLQNSNKDNSFLPFYEDGRDKVHSSITVSHLDNHNPLSRKTNDVDRYDESQLPPYYKKLYRGDRNVNLLPNETLPNLDVNYYMEDQPQSDFYHLSPAGPITAGGHSSSLKWRGRVS
ncbi:hypothetical protein Tsubulata_024516, partial [Turnera subulata]